MKALTYIAAVMPLLAIATYCLFSTPRRQNMFSKPTASHAIQTPPGNNQKMTPKVPGTAQERYQKYEKDQEVFNARMTASDKRLADSMKSLDMQKEYASIDRRVKRNEPAYRALFSEWGLDEKASREILETIHLREVMVFDAMVESFKNASVENGDHSDRAKVTARTNKTLANFATAKEFADSQLLPILGKEKLEQLKREEAKMLESHRTVAKGTEG